MSTIVLNRESDRQWLTIVNFPHFSTITYSTEYKEVSFKIKDTIIIINSNLSVRYLSGKTEIEYFSLDDVKIVCSEDAVIVSTYDYTFKIAVSV